MLMNAFVCGNFNHQEEDEVCPSPRKSKRSSKDHHSSRDNNPFSTRGLDKFSALLDDLDQRRKKLYSQMNPHDISFVRFTYSNSDDFVPIVVKVKNKDKKKHKSQELQRVPHFTSLSDNATEVNAAVEEIRKQQPMLESDKRATKKNKSFEFSWNFSLKRPSFYVPVVIILIMVFLSVFGRSVATLCTCVMWYLVPTLNDISSKPRKSVKNKDYVRGLSENKMEVTDSGASSNHKISGKHSHQKSW